MQEYHRKMQKLAFKKTKRRQKKLTAKAIREGNLMQNKPKDIKMQSRREKKPSPTNRSRSRKNQFRRYQRHLQHHIVGLILPKSPLQRLIRQNPHNSNVIFSEFKLGFL